jgi:hypothetical protein
MIEVSVTPEMIKLGAIHSIKMGALKHSFMDGDRNIVGCIGEQVYSQFAPLAERHDTYDYDFFIKNLKVDVKTRIIKTEPSHHFDFTIKQVKNNQDVDIYVFIGVHENLEKAWIFGWLKKSEFFEKSECISAGELMPQGGSYKAGGRRVYIHQMRQVPLQAEPFSIAKSIVPINS